MSVRKKEGRAEMIAFFVGLLTGFLICIPMGPINIWVINICLQKSAARALSIALGGSLMDFSYFLVAISGLSFVEFGEKTIYGLKIAGLSFILVLGIKEFFSNVTPIKKCLKKDTPATLLAGFFLGIVIYISNPTVIITMTGLGVFLKGLEIFDFNQVNIMLVSMGLFIGSFLWFVFLVKAIDRYEEMIRERYLNYITKLSGVLMIGFSLFMGQKLYF